MEKEHEKPKERNEREGRRRKRTRHCWSIKIEEEREIRWFITNKYKLEKTLNYGPTLQANHN